MFRRCGSNRSHMMLCVLDWVGYTAILYLIFSLSFSIIEYNAAPEQWYQVNEITVEDHLEGHEAQVTYSADVKKDFVAQWTAKIYRIGDDGDESSKITGDPVCIGSGEKRYHKGDETVLLTTLVQYMNKHCSLAGGRQYVVKTEWKIVGTSVVIKNTSNVFVVMLIKL